MIVLKAWFVEVNLVVELVHSMPGSVNRLFKSKIGNILWLQPRKMGAFEVLLPYLELRLQKSSFGPGALLKSHISQFFQPVNGA